MFHAVGSGGRAMEQMMRSRMGKIGGPAKERPKPELVAHGEHQEINGYSCEMYDVVREGVKERELCITEWDNIAGGPEAKAAMMDMARFLEAMTNARIRSVAEVVINVRGIAAMQGFS